MEKKLYMYILKDQLTMDLIVLGLNFQVVKYYTDEEIEMFRAIVERGLPSFYRWARQGGILSA